MSFFFFRKDLFVNFEKIFANWLFSDFPWIAIFANCRFANFSSFPFAKFAKINYLNVFCQAIFLLWKRIFPLSFLQYIYSCWYFEWLWTSFYEAVFYWCANFFHFQYIRLVLEMWLTMSFYTLRLKNAFMILTQKHLKHLSRISVRLYAR